MTDAEYKACKEAERNGTLVTVTAARNALRLGHERSAEWWREAFALSDQAYLRMQADVIAEQRHPLEDTP